MIGEILTYLNTELAQLNVFTKYYTLSEQISSEGKRFPAVFEKEFESINFGLTDSLVYHQTNGTPSFSTEESISACGTDFIYRIPLKAIGFLNISQLDKTKYTPFNIAEAMSVILMRNQDTTLKGIAHATRASVFSSGFNSNSESVFSDQFSIPYKMENDRFFISVNYEITLRMSKNCFDLNCFK